jgi:ribose-phosphate pyrophosphokinase
MKVISTERSQVLGARVAASLGVELVDVKFSRFPDGESYLNRSSLDDQTVIIGSVTDNDALVELLLLIDACDTSENTLVLPYMAYARQDQRFKDGEPISARAVARAVSRGVSRVKTINIHQEEVLSYFDIPAEDLSMAPDIGKHLLEMDLTDPLLLAPDEGAARFVADVAAADGWDWDHLQKTRYSGDRITIAPKSLAVKGREVVIIDDIISTGGTLATAAGMLKTQGASRVNAICVHGVLTGGAYAHLCASGVSQVIATDTIERGCSQITAADCIVRALQR